MVIKGFSEGVTDEQKLIIKTEEDKKGRPLRKMNRSYEIKVIKGRSSCHGSVVNESD